MRGGEILLDFTCSFLVFCSIRAKIWEEVQIDPCISHGTGISFRRSFFLAHSGYRGSLQSGDFGGRGKLPRTSL